MKIFNQYLIFLITLICIANTSFASDSIDFYRNTLSQKGIYTDILQEKKEDPLNIRSEDILVSNGRDNETLLLKSSQFDKYIKSDGFGVWNRVLIICDVPTQLDTALFCDFNGITVDNILSQEVIFPKKTDNIDYFYIPEKYFTYPSEQNSLDTAISSMTNTTEDSLATSGLENDTIKVAEFFRYTLVLFLIFNIFYYALPFLKNNPNLLFRKSFYENLLIRFFTWLSKFRIYNIYILLIALFSYPVILLTISLRDLGVFDVEYVINFLFDTLNPSNFPVFLEYRNVAKVALSISNYFLTTLVFLTIVPFLFHNIYEVLKQLKVPSFNSKKYLTLYLSSLGILLLMQYFGIYAKYSFLLLVLVIPTFVLPLFVDISSFNLHKNTKVTLVAVFISILLLNIFTSSKDATTIKYKNLLSSGKSSTFTPYTKYITGSERLRPFIIPITSYLFANEFLIAAPDVTSIHTLSIKDFSKRNMSNFLFVASSVDNYAKYLLADESLTEYVETTHKTTLFIIRAADIINKDAYIKMTFDCTAKPRIANIKSRVYEDSFYGKRDLDLFTFPGCEKGFVTYTFPINYAVIDSKFAIFHLMGFDTKYIVDMKIVDRITDTPIEVTYIKDPTESAVVSDQSKANPSKEITVFVFDDIDNLDFYQDSSTVDLSIPLNKLLEEELLDESFTIWSPKGNVIIDSSSRYGL